MIFILTVITSSTDYVDYVTRDPTLYQYGLQFSSDTFTLISNYRRTLYVFFVFTNGLSFIFNDGGEEETRSFNKYNTILFSRSSNSSIFFPKLSTLNQYRTIYIAAIGLEDECPNDNFLYAGNSNNGVETYSQYISGESGCWFIMSHYSSPTILNTSLNLKPDDVISYRSYNSTNTTISMIGSRPETYTLSRPFSLFEHPTLVYLETNVNDTAYRSIKWQLVLPKGYLPLGPTIKQYITAVPIVKPTPTPNTDTSNKSAGGKSITFYMLYILTPVICVLVVIIIIIVIVKAVKKNNASSSSSSSSSSSMKNINSNKMVYFNGDMITQEEYNRQMALNNPNYYPNANSYPNQSQGYYQNQQIVPNQQPVYYNPQQGYDPNIQNGYNVSNQSLYPVNNNNTVF